MLRIRERHGVLSGVQQGDASFVFAFSPEHNRELLAGTGRFYIRALAETAPKSSALYRMRTHLLGLNGEAHRKARRIVSSAFTRPRVEGYREDMAALADKLFERWRPGEVVDAEREMQQLALWVVSHTVYGVSPDDANLGLGAAGPLPARAVAEGRATLSLGVPPFGAGPHVCVGMGLAALEIRLTLAMLLQRLTLLPPEGARIDHQVQATLSTKAVMPMRVLPRQRVVSPPRIEGDLRELFEAPSGT